MGTNAEPLAPPPPRATEPDYFSAKHQILSTESNPFEYSFAGGTGPLTNGLVTPGYEASIRCCSDFTSLELLEFWDRSALWSVESSYAHRSNEGRYRLFWRFISA